MDLKISTSREVDNMDCLSNSNPLHKKRQDQLSFKQLNSDNILYSISLDNYIFEYRAKRIITLLFHWLGLNTWVQLPTNVMIRSQLIGGFWLRLIIYEPDLKTKGVRIKRLSPVFIPGWRSARRLHKRINAIIDRNIALSNPKALFVDINVYRQVMNKNPSKEQKDEMPSIAYYSGKTLA